MKSAACYFQADDGGSIPLTRSVFAGFAGYLSGGGQGL
jgi:hypothetical protein